MPITCGWVQPNPSWYLYPVVFQGGILTIAREAQRVEFSYLRNNLEPTAGTYLAPRRAGKRRAHGVKAY